MLQYIDYLKSKEVQNNTKSTNNQFNQTAWLISNSQWTRKAQMYMPMLFLVQRKYWPLSHFMELRKPHRGMTLSWPVRKRSIVGSDQFIPWQTDRALLNTGILHYSFSGKSNTIWPASCSVETEPICITW